MCMYQDFKAGPSGQKQVMHACILLYFVFVNWKNTLSPDMSTDKSVMENLLKDKMFSEMSLIYIDQEAIEDLKEIGQGDHNNYTLN